MSPEQTRSGEMDLDTRTDIYSLGAVLYELLTGCRPLGNRRLSELPIEVALAAIRNEEPVIPSQRVRAKAFSESQKANSLAQLINPRDLQGDLDWIAMKALDKDRSRRYASAVDLAADLERYLDGAPVVAVPPSALYRAKKFVRKNRAFVIAASAIIAALVFGILGTSWGMLRAMNAEQAAVDRSNQAEKNLLYAQKTVGALQAVLKQATPSTVGSTAEQAEEVAWQLEKLLEELAGEPDSDQRELAKIRRMFGEVMMDLGHPEKSVSILRAGVIDCQNVYGKDHPITVDSMTYLARAYLLSNQVSEAVQTLEQVLDLQSRKHGLYSVEAFQARCRLDNYYMYVDPHLSAQRATETLNLSTIHQGPEAAVTIRSMAVLQSALRESFQFEKALELGCRLVAITKDRELPDSLLHLASGPRNSLAATFTESGLFEKGQRLFEESYAFRVELYGIDHPYTLHTLGWLGRSYYFDGQLGISLPILEKRYEQSLAQIGPNDSATLEGKSNLGAVYRDCGQLELSERFLEETLDARIDRFGFHHRDTMWTGFELAKTYAAKGQYEKSLALFEWTIFLMELSLGGNDPDFLAAVAGFAEVHLELGNLETAEALIDLSLQGIERLNYFHRVAFPIVKTAVIVYEAVNRVDDCAELLDRWHLARQEHLMLAETCEDMAINHSINR